MLARIALVSTLALGACADPGELRLVVLDERVEGKRTAETVLPELVADACDVLGIRCRPVKRGTKGALVLELFALDPARPGVKARSIGGGCYPAVWADLGPEGAEHVVPRSRTLAHEFGHALELEHVARVDALMVHGGEGLELDADELAAIDDALRALAGCT